MTTTIQLSIFKQSLSTTSNMDRQLLRQKFVKYLSNEDINTRCFQRNDITKIVNFGILIHVLS